KLCRRRRLKQRQYRDRRSRNPIVPRWWRMAKKIVRSGCVLLLALSATMALAQQHASSGTTAGSISGLVHDSAGAPLMGAAVQIFTNSSSLATIVYTDQAGHFLLHDLAPGIYQLKVSAATFLPTLRANLALRNGAHQIVNVTLNTLFEAMQLLPARKQSPQDDDDWKWTLRAAGNRPILRIMDDGAVVVARFDEPKEGAMKAKVAFMAAGGDDGPFARSGEMTAFTLEHSLFSSGTVSVKGNVGYNGNGNVPWSVVRAAYSHQAPDGSRPEMALT